MTVVLYNTIRACTFHRTTNQETSVKNTQLLLIFTVTVMVLAFLTVTGCDEGMNMVSPVITEPGEEPMTPDGPITTNGDMKQPPDETPAKQPEQTPEEPSEPEKPEEPETPEKPEVPTEPETPEEPKTPTVTIAGVMQADDTSVTISGTSTNVPEGAKVTIVLGDGAITVKAVVAKDGAWTATVPAKKTAQLAPGTIPVTATTRKVTAESSFEIAPPPEPTLTINSVVQADDGSVTISGTSTELARGTTVTVMLDGTLRVTARTDNAGAWTAMVPAADTAQLSAGTVMVAATASSATAESSFHHIPPPPEPEEEAPGHGIVASTGAEQIMLDIVLEISGYDDSTATDKQRRVIKNKYNYITALYGSLFDVETEVGRATFQRFAEYEFKKWELATTGGGLNSATLDQYFGEAYGFSVDFAISLVHDVYLEEKPEDKKLLRIKWQVDSIGMEYLLLQIANPGASEEELLELLRESIRAGNVSIAA